MADTLAENLKNEIATRASWTTPCTFKRTNRIPIDPKSCFKTYAELEQYIADPESTAYPGMFVAVTSNQEEGQGAYVLVGNENDQLVPKKLSGIQQVDGGGIKSFTLQGAEDTHIDAEVDENGHATLRIEELEFEELHTQELYLDGVNIKTMIPNFQAIRNLPEAETFIPDPEGEFDLETLLVKHNELVGMYNNLLNALKGAVAN